MRIGKDSYFHLAYCTKIHPARNWQEQSEALHTYIPALKNLLSPAQPFGLALRLSEADSVQLLEPALLEALQDFLQRQDSYVFTINGFPFGSFYGEPVKAKIFAPDWQDEKRTQYTLRLIAILRRLLPPGTEGSISTLPLSYKSWVPRVREAKALERIVLNLLRIVEELVQVRDEHGLDIHLDIEPEPDGLVENIPEFIHFYKEWLFTFGAPILAYRLKIKLSVALQYLQNHVQLCLDTCHLAVAYEDPAEAVELLAQEGIGIGKVQIASGLKVLFKGEDRRRKLFQCLGHFANSPYLHQVIGRQAKNISSRFSDLCQAMPHLDTCRDEEWRIHYHMPLFVRKYRMLQTTQAETLQVLQLLKKQPFTRHLEIETYTWEQLPADLKTPLHDSLWKEYRWVMEALERGKTAAIVPAS